eukprot:CAMPEP_0183803112 /NCGR_PEP_ID=MMETSP0803_2-20130417/32197_1 /TAXON_ID=195967 /ORGANISM="Crustomastix stigmata, Strain CCMP3273" /LENGTH=399 /DNA_ID=CAMNT_0026047847 /DNA_START=22 /DNA_END=1221 /DNA_ORIENTATION=+
MKFSGAAQQAMTGLEIRFSVVFYILFSLSLWAQFSNTGRPPNTLAMARTAEAALRSLLSFFLVTYNGHAYARYSSNWLAVMKGWSRLNDAGLQVYAYLEHSARLSHDVLRLLHAFFHLVFLEFSGQLARRPDESWDVLVRRHLLSNEEVDWLRSRGGGYSATCIHQALRLVGAEVKAGRLDGNLALGLDRSIAECRQNTTLLPLICETPIPFPYFQVSIIILSIWSLSAGYVFASYGFIFKEDAYPTCKWKNWSISLFVYVLLVFSFDTLKRTAIALTEPFGDDAVDLPVEEYVMRPLLGHRTVFQGTGVAASAVPSTPFGPCVKGVQDFTAPFENELDVSFVTEFKKSETYKAAQVAQSRFHPIGVQFSNQEETEKKGFRTMSTVKRALKEVTVNIGK